MSISFLAVLWSAYFAAVFVAAAKFMEKLGSDASRKKLTVLLLGRSAANSSSREVTFNTEGVLEDSAILLSFMFGSTPFPSAKRALLATAIFFMAYLVSLYYFNNSSWFFKGNTFLEYAPRSLLVPGLTLASATFGMWFSVLVFNLVFFETRTSELHILLRIILDLVASILLTILVCAAIISIFFFGVYDGFLADRTPSDSMSLGALHFQEYLEGRRSFRLEFLASGLVPGLFLMAVSSLCSSLLFASVCLSTWFIRRAAKTLVRFGVDEEKIEKSAWYVASLPFIILVFVASAMRLLLLS
ncbi:hypothetical protein [Epibacterium ulvae]|uniref:hypothetical protein n=1 Tax=Epibacterium ulvae TaxID=1156985 RepID=UPI0024939489|nr:hypothetical protein [Epibacterium ulvae]